jgi:hypothetical protein
MQNAFVSKAGLDPPLIAFFAMAQFLGWYLSTPIRLHLPGEGEASRTSGLCGLGEIAKPSRSGSFTPIWKRLIWIISIFYSCVCPYFRGHGHSHGRKTTIKRSTICPVITFLSANTWTRHGGPPRMLCRSSLDYGHAGQDEITGGSPYGATTIAGGDGSRSAPQISCRAPAIRAARSRNKLHG